MDPVTSLKKLSLHRDASRDFHSIRVVQVVDMPGLYSAWIRSFIHNYLWRRYLAFGLVHVPFLLVDGLIATSKCSLLYHDRHSLLQDWQKLLGPIPASFACFARRCVKRNPPHPRHKVKYWMLQTIWPKQKPFTSQWTWIISRTWHHLGIRSPVFSHSPFGFFGFLTQSTVLVSYNGPKNRDRHSKVSFPNWQDGPIKSDTETSHWGWNFPFTNQDFMAKNVSELYLIYIHPVI